MKNKRRKGKSVTVHRNKVPWHIWLVGLLFLFIYGYGIFDYFMMLGLNSAYYDSNNFGPAVYEYFSNYPVVPLIFWTINVFSGLIASILLLFRTRWAMWVALISAVSMLCLQVLTFSFMNRWNVLGPWISLFDIALLILTSSLFYYCRRLLKRGILQ
ncbi:hypothetical protein [Alkalihalophilus marmarensis]|uniref:hypothetical protein n=1 Tax=Alkalihalophilus marmarensis TaxID=521377 RepID=UPI002DB9A4F1|nr:hypothetical protein [Alkalihalophilus marmarensis]MEC2072446.1 hypothetical protein [Alkalihalophilus marmarensis]